MQKLSLSLIVVVLLTVIGMGWGIGQYYNRIMDDKKEDKQELDFYHMLGKKLANMLDSFDEIEPHVDTWQQEENFDISLLEQENLPLPVDLKQKFLQGQPVTLESEESLQFYFFLENHNKILAIEFAVLQQESKGVNLSLTLLFYSGIIFVILLWLYPLIRRLQLLRRAAVEFGSGSLDVRVNSSRISYIGEIEQEFNRMAERIQDLISDNKLLSRAVSHDLKTPLARLRFGIETLEETQDEKQREHYHQRIEKDLDSMEQLVEDLLQYARLDEANIHLSENQVALEELAEQCLVSLRDGQHILALNVNGDCTVRGEVKYLKMLLNNIVCNAVQHCEEKVMLSIDTQDDGVLLRVEDDGPGIPVSDREKILQPFIRGENSGTKKGHGMGLAIVARIAIWHQAELHIDDSPRYGGAQISIKFPVLA